MLSDAIGAYYRARVQYNRAESNSKDEDSWLTLMLLATNNLFDSARSYEEGMRIKRHISYLCDRQVWSCFNSLTDLHCNITYKGKI